MSDFQFRLWVYLITYVDDYGRGSADPEILKGYVFPRLKRIRESDIEKALADLADIGAICLYKVEGESHLYFPNWSSHQRIQTKKSKFPEPPTEINGDSRCTTVNHGYARALDSYSDSSSDSSLNSNSEGERGCKGKGETKKSTFDEFWSAYPKKRSKGDAQKAWNMLKPDKQLVDDIMYAISFARETNDWKKEGGKYIPYPATWLRASGWEDSFDVQVERQKTGMDYLQEIYERERKNEQDGND